jgi:hypothetical protein
MYIVYNTTHEKQTQYYISIDSICTGLALLKGKVSLHGAWRLLSPKILQLGLLLVRKDTNDDESYMW